MGKVAAELFIRFATDRTDEDTQRPVGVFSVAYQLLREDEIAEYQQNEIRTALDWFQNNLSVPERFSKSRKPHRESKGVCWFKAEAIECMRNVRHLIQLISEHDVIVRELTTKLPGYIIYEDTNQVVTEPFSSTPQ